MAGIERARTVIAVNADRTAPLLGRAQLAALADWRPVAEALIERLRARRVEAADRQRLRCDRPKAVQRPDQGDPVGRLPVAGDPALPRHGGQPPGERARPRPPRPRRAPRPACRSRAGLPSRPRDRARWPTRCSTAGSSRTGRRAGAHALLFAAVPGPSRLGRPRLSTIGSSSFSLAGSISFVRSRPGLPSSRAAPGVDRRLRRQRTPRRAKRDPRSGSWLSSVLHRGDRLPPGGGRECRRPTCCSRPVLVARGVRRAGAAGVAATPLHRALWASTRRSAGSSSA